MNLENESERVNQGSDEDVEREKQTLRREIAGLRAQADRLEKDFDKIAKLRAASGYTRRRGR